MGTEYWDNCPSIYRRPSREGKSARGLWNGKVVWSAIREMVLVK
jgi:hypothetical protein